MLPRTCATILSASIVAMVLFLPSCSATTEGSCGCSNGQCQLTFSLPDLSECAAGGQASSLSVQLQQVVTEIGSLNMRLTGLAQQVNLHSRALQELRESHHNEPMTTTYPTLPTTTGAATTQATNSTTAASSTTTKSPTTTAAAEEAESVDVEVGETATAVEDTTVEGGETAVSVEDTQVQTEVVEPEPEATGAGNSASEADHEASAHQTPDNDQQSVANTACPDEFTPHDGQCYMLVTAPQLSWPDAEQMCEDLHSHLVSIISQDQQQYIESLIQTSENGFWTGGNSVAQEGAWVWQNGKNMSYNNWGEGEPNQPNTNRCLHLCQSHSWAWNASPCDELNGFICSKDIV